MWDVTFGNPALRFLKRADKVLLGRITEKIEEIRKNPIFSGTVRIQGHNDFWRVRVGDYRIIYCIRSESPAYHHNQYRS